jgi:DNA-binding NarL/FixJ family response regulator
MSQIRVLIADDHALMREGLRGLLQTIDGIEIVGEAETGREAVELAVALKPDVVLMDIAMPLLSGLEATRQLSKRVPSTRVLVLSSYNDDDFVQQLAEVGGAGYLLKQGTYKDVLRAIHEAHKGNAFFSPAICKRLSDKYRESIVRGAPLNKGKPQPLTSRETELLQLIAEGRGNKQAAAQLGLSIKTVERHRQRLMDKLDIHDVAGLTRYAISRGLVESSAAARTTVLQSP